MPQEKLPKLALLAKANGRLGEDQLDNLELGARQWGRSLVEPVGKSVLPFRPLTIGERTAPPRWGGRTLVNHQVPKVFSEELLLSRPIRCELSRLRYRGHSLFLSSYLHRISRKENSACSACGHPLRDLNHLLLDCSASEPFRKSIFGSSLSILDLWSMVQNLGCGPIVGSPRSSSAPPSLGRGRVVPPPPRTRWTNLGWNCFGLHPTKMMDVMEDREVWRVNLELLPRNPHGKVGNEKRERL